VGGGWERTFSDFGGELAFALELGENLLRSRVPGKQLREMA
jgi:hypothetical protein